MFSDVLPFVFLEASVYKSIHVAVQPSQLTCCSNAHAVELQDVLCAVAQGISLC